jgi:transposase
VLDQDLALLKAVQERIAQSDKLVQNLFQSNSEIKYLQSLPGLGIFLSTLIFYETDGVGRFISVKHFHSYCGLIPFLHSSGGKTRTGPITNGGNKWLRYAFIEAVWPAIRQDPSLRNYYQKMKSKKGPNPAKVATARRLATIAYQLMREKRYYRRTPSVALIFP